MPMRTVKSEISAALGATATGNTVVEAPFAGKVIEATFTPLAAVTGAASPASRTLSLVNRGQTGVGTTVVASLALVSGVNLVQFDEKALTLSTTASDLVVAAGDELTFTSTAVTSGTGLADPGGTWSVTFERND
jgi:hypothetical protein